MRENLVPAAGDAADWDERLDDVLTATVEQCGASSGGVYLLRPDEGVLDLAVVRGLPAEFIAPWTRIALTAPAPSSDAARDCRMVWSGSHEDFARLYPRIAVSMPYHFALAAAPICRDGRRWGSLLMLWPGSRPSHLTPADRELIVAGCDRLAELLAGADAAGQPVTAPLRPRVLPRRLAAAKLPEAAATAFAERLPGGSCALDLNGRITFLTDTACALLGAEREHLLGAIPWQTLPWLDDPDFEDRYRAAIISRQPVAFTAMRPPDQWLDFRLYTDGNGISVRITPTSAGRATTPAPGPGGHRPTPVSRAGQLYQIMHLAAALTEAVTVDDVIALVAEQILPAFDAQGLAMMSAEDGRLQVTGYRGYTAAEIARYNEIPLDERTAPMERAITAGVPGFFDDPESLARAFPKVPQVTGKQAWAVLPLVTSGRPVGCCLLAYDQPHRFAGDERTVLTSLAGLIAQALDRAHLYDTKNRLAHDLQQALLPHALPTVDGLRVAARYLPATREMDIGGDFYDLIRLGPTSAAAVIGDVQGHNVPAAALMSQVRTAVHATAGAAPDQVLVRVNRLLCDLDPGLFTTCLYAHLNLAAHRAFVVNAGHPPPLLRPPGRSTTRVLDIPPGLPLGIDAGAAYPITEVEFDIGALMLLYTDGLVESPHTDLDEAIAAVARQLDHAAPDLETMATDLVAGAQRSGQRADDIATFLLEATQPR
ncbi:MULTISPECIES: SpoIIE family protein phosphatase [Kitasatospora]|uniref:PAS domain-containing protein n=2 Tax=Kitasatospora TaxID=2063 RepID=A0ABT1J1N5_9ACTN|nr:SpoIIE family protein phosphatase [Kitasatospora paracochleata]MCP2311332.1 PAS domain-containing protein [Kitasatospora paracochleata]